jgi:hypothetical protein
MHSRLSESDSNSAKCVVCLQVTDKWGSTDVPIYKLIQRPEDAKDMTASKFKISQSVRLRSPIQAGRAVDETRRCASGIETQGPLPLGLASLRKPAVGIGFAAL